MDIVVQGVHELPAHNASTGITKDKKLYITAQVGQTKRQVKLTDGLGGALTPFSNNAA